MHVRRAQWWAKKDLSTLTDYINVRMTQAGYLTVSDNPADKRSRLYRIKEGFFDLWLAMSESRVQQKKLPYLVSFFEIYYADRKEREAKRSALRGKMEEEKKGDNGQTNNSLEMLDYLSELGDSDENIQTKLELALHQIKEGKATDAKSYLAETTPILPQKSTFIWMNQQAGRWADGEIELDVQKWLDDLIAYWRLQRSGDLEKAVEIAARLAMDISGSGLHGIRIELLEDVLNHKSRAEEKARLHLQIAKSQSMDGRLADALGSLQSALQRYGEISDKSGEGATLNRIGIIYHGQGDYDTALAYLNRSLAIRQEIGDKSGLCATLFNMGHIHAQNNQIDEAIRVWLTVYVTAKQMKLAQALQALAKLAPQLGMPEGLEGWEQLAQQKQNEADS